MHKVQFRYIRDGVEVPGLAIERVEDDPEHPFQAYLANRFGDSIHSVSHEDLARAAVDYSNEFGRSKSEFKEVVHGSYE